MTKLDRLYRAIPLATAFLWLVILYGWQTRGSKLQYAAKARKVGCQTIPAPTPPRHTVRGRS